MSQQRSALDCIRSMAVPRLFAHSDSLFLHVLWPHMSLVSLWSFEICDFQIESRKFESNRKSNPKALNRIFYCQIESLIAVKSRFKSNRDSDLPTTAVDIGFVFQCMVDNPFYTMSWYVQVKQSNLVLPSNLATVQIFWQFLSNVLDLFVHAVVIRCFITTLACK